MVRSADGRPVGVTLTTALLYIVGFATIVAGAALVWYRDESIAQLPVLLARVDDALPFADSWEDWQYVAAFGILLVLIGVFVMVCAAYLSLGSRLAYVVVVVLAAALVAGSILVMQHTSDDLITWAAQAMLAVSAVVLIALVLLLVAPRTRRFLGGR